MKKDRNDEKRQDLYITGVDGLRATAVLMVFAYHLGLPFSKGGLLGVTVFFVISGFLVTRILIAEIANTNTINLKKFWIRRIKRLLPAVLVMVTVLIFVSAVFNRVLFTKACSDLPSAIFGYNNWWQIFNKVSYFENVGVPSPLTHFWSLAIEVQFYLLYPLLLFFLAKLKNWEKISGWVTILAAIISAGAMWILFNLSVDDPGRVYYGTDTRAFSILFGAFLAFLENRGTAKKLPCIWRNVIGITAFTVLFCMMATIDGNSSFLYRGGHGIASVCTVLVIYSLLDAEGILSRILSAPSLKWIGERSYGIYLWHYPVLLLISQGRKSSWQVNVIVILLTGLLSALSYRFIETPVRRGAIEKSIEIVKSQPKTRAGYKRVAECFAVLGMAVGVLLCVAFVPRESALSNIEELEKQAEKANEIVNQKTIQLKRQKKAAAEQEDKKRLLPEDGQGGKEESMPEDGQTGKEESMPEEKQEDGEEILPKEEHEKPLSDEEILSSLNLLLIGDSIALGATEGFYSAFPAGISDAAVSRQATEGIGIYDSYVNAYGWNGDGLIFALGSNGLFYGSLSTIREMAGADRPLFILSIRAPYVSWEGSNNQEIYEFVENSENTYLIDWYKISEGHGEYFAADGTHLTPEGVQAYINGMKETVLEVYRK